MMSLDNTFILAQQNIDKARQMLIKTRSLSSRHEEDMRNLRSMVQRSRLLGQQILSDNFGTALCDYLEGYTAIRNSQDALAAHLTMALSFTVEAMNYMVAVAELDTSINRIKVRTIISKVRFILNDFDARPIPKDGLAFAIARGETLSLMGGFNYSEIHDMLKGLRQIISYY